MTKNSNIDGVKPEDQLNVGLQFVASSGLDGYAPQGAVAKSLLSKAIGGADIETIKADVKNNLGGGV